MFWCKYYPFRMKYSQSVIDKWKNVHVLWVKINKFENGFSLTQFEWTF